MPIKAEVRQVWRCSFCGRPFMNKGNAERHEYNDCRDPKSPRVQNCKHQWDIIWKQGYDRLGALRAEPDHHVCTECYVRDCDLEEAGK